MADLLPRRYAVHPLVLAATVVVALAGLTEPAGAGQAAATPPVQKPEASTPTTAEGTSTDIQAPGPADTHQMWMRPAGPNWHLMGMAQGYPL